MQESLELFDQSKKLLLFKLNSPKGSKSRLMPCHWLLYESLIQLATEKEQLLFGKDIPNGVAHICMDLIDEGVLSEHPITYDQWSKSDELKEKLSASNDTHLHSTLTVEEDEIFTDSSDDSSVEVDLDFLDN